MQHIFSLLFRFYLIQSIQSLTCDDSCYNIQLNQVRNQNDDEYCYEYSVTLIDSTTTCNAITGTAQIKFGINTNECYINAADLSSKIISTTPDTHIIFDDDSDPQTIIGIQFEVTDTITICIKGVNPSSLTTAAPLKLSDDSTECIISDYSDSPNFCGICDGKSGENSCFCQDSQAECISAVRPRNDLICSWDTSNTVNDRCIAVTASECIVSSNNPQPPCICYINRNQCNLEASESQRDCAWDSVNNLCTTQQCVDDLNCDCFVFEQDCESTDDLTGIDTQCIWSDDDDECMELTPEPTPIPTLQPTPCIFHCDCFETQSECIGEHVGEFRCHWFNEKCEEITTTTTTTASPTRSPRSTRTPRPTPSTTWKRPSTTKWSKTTTKKGGWSKSKKGNKSGGKKGGKKGGKR